MQQICKQCTAEFEITESDLAFYENVSPVFNGKKELIPPPTLCPLCRLRRRTISINQIAVFTHTSSNAGKRIFSMFPQNVPFPVYDNEYWWSDAWEPSISGMDVETNQPIFPQLRTLQEQTPHYASMVMKNENCDYCNNASEDKNCYLCFNVRRSEDCICCERSVGNTSCYECTDSAGCELCYQCAVCTRCYNTQDSQECTDCSNSFFLLNCQSCQSCFCCTNLLHAEYCIFNEQKTKEEYEAFMKDFNGSSHQQREEWRQKATTFWQSQPRPHAVMSMVEDVSGNHIFESKNVHDSFLVRNGENLRYCAFVFDNVHDCMDFTAYGDRVEWVYEIARCGNGFSRSAFCHYCYDGSSDLYYCAFCVGCQDCFGCNGLRKKRYCIFNKQYTKEEYERRVPLIIEQMRQTGEWGEFFPATDSPFPFNHSMGKRYFPLTRDEALREGLFWLEEEFPEAAQAIESSALPDGLPQVDDPLIVKSASSDRPFKITAQEIRACRQFGAPLPRTTYDERMEERFKRLGGITLYDRTCAKTGKPIKTTIPPDSPWIVWDREAWEQEFRS